MEKISCLEEKVAQMEQDYVAFKDQTAHEISKLNKENIQLKQSLGPKISSLLQQSQKARLQSHNTLQQTKNVHEALHTTVSTPASPSRQPTSCHQQYATVTREQLWVEVARSSKNRVATRVPPRTPNKIDFDVNKVMMIKNIVDVMTSGYSCSNFFTKTDKEE